MLVVCLEGVPELRGEPYPACNIGKRTTAKAREGLRGIKRQAIGSPSALPASGHLILKGDHHMLEIPSGPVGKDFRRQQRVQVAHDRLESGTGPEGFTDSG
eukprot:6468531-Amphidinium_carterae.1